MKSGDMASTGSLCVSLLLAALTLLTALVNISDGRTALPHDRSHSSQCQTPNLQPCPRCLGLQFPLQHLKTIYDGPAARGTIKAYFDLAEERCISFTYNGFRANGNIFDSEEECMASCEHDVLNNGVEK